MKVTIEINDQSLQHAIENQVGKAVAAFTDQIIREKVEGIIALKLDRLGQADVERALAQASSEKIDKALGNTVYARQQALTQALSAAALQAIKGVK